MSKQKLVPQLRFPEFVKEWEEQDVAEIYDFKVTNSLSRENLNYKKGQVKNIHYGDIHTKFDTRFDINRELVPFINPGVPIDKIKEEQYCIEGDIVFADASEDLNDIGKSIEIVNLNKAKLVCGLHTLLARQKEKKLSIGFGGYLFKSDSVKRQIQREAQGAKVLGISVGRLSKVKVPYPKSEKEQQRIAACLSSLDELIAAHKDKLQALKDHKKGLMQSLFPQEGETVPKYRFPEFENEGEWVEKKLGEVASFASGSTPSKDEPGFWGGKIPWISAASMYSTELRSSSSSITEQAVTEGARIAKKGSLLILVRGSMLFNRIPMGIAIVDVGFNQDVKALTIDEKVNTRFLLSLLYSKEFQLLNNVSATGIGAGKLDSEYLKGLPIHMPSLNEQQKIASCLSALDELITAQTKKIEQLQLHKKGLMQGLFPNVIE